MTQAQTPSPVLVGALSGSHPSGQAAARLDAARFDPGQGDLIQLIARRLALVDGINASLAARRANRPKGQQVYRDRAARQHRERVAAHTAFLKGEKA